MLYTLYFENEYGQERAVCAVNCLKDAFFEIRKFCQDRNFKVYYIRIFSAVDATDEQMFKLSFDCGSWSEFFHIYFDTKEKMEDFLSQGQSQLNN